MKQGYKKTSLGIIPNEWEVVKLGDVCKFYKGKGISKKDISENGINCIRYGELYTTYNEKIDKVYSRTNLNIDGLFLSKFNDIIIASSGETAIDISKASCVLLYNIALGSDLNVLRTKENGIFISYYLNHIAKNKIAKLAQGVSIVHLYASDLKNLKIVLPPLKEQIKIAEILSEFDTAINLMSILISQKTKFKKALMQNLLTAKIRFPNFKDKWQEVKLGEIGEFKTSSVDKIIKNNERIVSLINYMDVYKNTHIDINLKLSKTSATKQEIEKFCVKKGDVLFTPSSETPDDIGHSAVICDNFNYTLYSYHLVRFRSFINFDNIFLGYVFNNEKILKQFSKLSQGITRYTLSIKDFQNIKIKLPNLDEQKKIAEILSSVDDEINLLNLKLKNLKDLKKGVMQNLLTGKVRVDG